jgi:hypothetical protein
MPAPSHTLSRSSSSDPASRRPNRFHGRVGDGTRPCQVAGCEEPGEFRAPGRVGGGNEAGEDRWRWLCLDHVRAFNAGFNYFAGMTIEEISAAQTPYGGWEPETHAFAGKGADPAPRWANFADPLDAIGAGIRGGVKDRASVYERARRGPSETPRARALRTLDLPADADRSAIRRRYAALLRKFHPDQNGGDRRHEKALQAVVAAYTELKTAR